MAIEKLGSVAGMPSAPTVGGGKEAFGRSMGQPTGEMGSLPVRASPTAHGPKAAGTVSAVARSGAAAPPGTRVPGSARSEPAHQLARGIDRVAQAQRRLDHILHVAESGKTFTPAELLALQAQVYQASNELDLAGKVVDKATGGVKQVLQTQV